MLHHWILLSFFIFLGRVWAQDERYYRQILSGELPEFYQESKEGLGPQLSIRGASYKIDLNEDGVDETIQPQKRDGVDWIEIKNSQEAKVFEAKLLAMGVESQIYKIKFVKISPKVKALILFLDEGKTQSKKFESTARLYFITFENNDLKSMKITQGPHFFHERESQRDQYFRREYMVNIYDVNNDGIREIAIQFNHIQKIYQYAGSGEWRVY
ncbi:MAG: hypothetical protein AB7I27_09630 [Bacteriovoracaceae bacterium]